MMTPAVLMHLGVCLMAGSVAGSLLTSGQVLYGIVVMLAPTLSYVCGLATTTSRRANG
jgi:hypothetical protein